MLVMTYIGSDLWCQQSGIHKLPPISRPVLPDLGPKTPDAYRLEVQEIYKLDPKNPAQEKLLNIAVALMDLSNLQID